MSRWWQVRSPLRLTYNYALIWLSRHCKLITVRNILLRLTGMRVGKGVSIAPDVSFDFFFPERIEIGEGAVIGYQALIVAHEFLVDEYRVGNTVIGARALIGARAMVLAGVHIGNGAQIGAMSLVHDDIPAYSLAVGVPAKVVKSFLSSRLNKHRLLGADGAPRPEGPRGNLGKRQPSEHSRD